MIRTLLSAALLLFYAGELLAQTGSIKGQILDKTNGQPVPFANVVAEAHGRMVSGASTDFDGWYVIKPLEPGKYDIKAKFIGYKTFMTTNVVVSPDKITFLNIKMDQAVELLEEVTIVDYKQPLIEKDNPGSHETILKEDIAKIPGRSALSVAQTVSGVYSKDDGSGDLNVRGTRDEATDIYIDGVKVRGSSSVPAQAIEQVSVFAGGLPAQYGDATGGIISITTRGPSKDFSGSLEYLTSGFSIKDKNYGLDPYGYNLIGFNLTGPLVKIRDEFDTTKYIPLLGFFLAGEITAIKDPEPTAFGLKYVDEDTLSWLKTNPLKPAPSGTGMVTNASYLRSDDFVTMKARQNALQRGITLNAKVDVRTGPNLNLTFGGTFDIMDRNDRDFATTLYNNENQGEILTATKRGWVRFAQKFPSDTSRKSQVVKNAYYTVQFDYEKYTDTRRNRTHKKDFFNYGYIGKFTTYSANSYGYAIDDTINLKGWIHSGFQDTLYSFEPSDLNPDLAAYTSNFYDENPSPENSTEVLNGFGLINGWNPDPVYSADLWQNVGDVYNNYTFRSYGQFRLNASGSADIGNHAISAGFEYEQREERMFRVRPQGLWENMRQNVNSHILQLDLSNPYRIYYTSSGERLVITDKNWWPVTGDTTFADTIYYDRYYDGGTQTLIDFNLRNTLNKPTDGIDWIDVNSLPPETFSLNHFSPDELLDNGTGAGGGSSFVDYYGFDPYGKKLKYNPTVDEFFTKEITVTGYNGPTVFERPVGPYRPIYMSGYIQDKFAFKDLIFNVGLRVDRFDANQPVLKDPYLWFPAVTAGEIRSESDRAKLDVEIPENIGDKYVVYVDNIQKPTSIVGYRNNDIWYNSSGAEINDPSALETSAGIIPYLIDPSRTRGTDMRSDAFTDYSPQVTPMPRIAFSFPISDEALFFAHYDVLSERPSSPTAEPIERLDLTHYFFVDNRNITLNNPALKPSLTVDYELGFQQALNKNSSLKLSTFYRELRDYIQVSNYVGAYPVQYRTFKNLDFGTVKGFNVGYDLRRLGNARVRANYALQFAEGTGSSYDQANNLIRAGQPNLKIISPFNYDQRHFINLSFDWRYASGGEYDGPVIGNKQILANSGINFLFNAGSGTPYSRYITAVPLGTTGNLVGSLNGARLPWQFRMDARVDKDFNLTVGGKPQESTGEGSEPLPKKGGRNIAVNVYLQVLNVLNTKNIVSVYGFTGNPDDDGYLTSANAQTYISQQLDEQSYRDLYSIRMLNPDNFSLPRRMRLGVILNF